MSSGGSFVRTHCTCFPDSCILLHHAFDEKDFAAKLSILEKHVSERAIPCEILPRVNYEITRKMIKTAEEFRLMLESIPLAIEAHVQQPRDLILLGADSLSLIEKVGSDLARSIGNQFPDGGRPYEAAMKRMRLIESSFVSEYYSMTQVATKTASAFSLGDLTRKLAESFADQYAICSERMSAFCRRINAAYVLHTDIPKASRKLRSKLGVVIRNAWDVEVLCQAASRMVRENRWGALVTTDYSDLMRNREMIERETLLLVSDPLYFLKNLESRMELKATPDQEMKRRNLSYGDVIEVPAATAVV